MRPVRSGGPRFLKSADTKRDRRPHSGRILAPFRRKKHNYSKRIFKKPGDIMIHANAIRVIPFLASCGLAVAVLAFSTIFLAPQDAGVRAQGASEAAAGPKDATRRAVRGPEGAAYQHLVQQHAAANGLPPELVHRVIMRESRYNPRAVSKGNYGMMQIRLGTARAMGYRGDAAGLLDANTNMTYAVKYLAGAYRAAGGNHDRAVMNYARGYYHQAKAKGFSPYEAPGAATPAARGAYAQAGEPAAAAAATASAPVADVIDPMTARESSP
jgi:soluble lytic murein transglycosylase-like protein